MCTACVRFDVVCVVYLFAINKISFKIKLQQSH